MKKTYPHIPVEYAGFSVRAKNTLKRFGCVTLADAANLDETTLLAKENFGKTSLDQVKRVLRANGLALGGQRVSKLVWNPIETAPKDGTAVLVFGVWFGEVDEGGDDARDPSPHVAEYSHGDWFVTGSCVYAGMVTATHWLPLPTPPKE